MSARCYVFSYILSAYLNGQGLVLGYAQSHAFALRIECIQIDVSNDPQRACCRREAKLGKVFVGELGLAPAAFTWRDLRRRQEVL